MYKLGVVSDSHGNAEMVKRASERLKDVSAVAHLGDHKSDAALLTQHGRELFSIPGNCDGWSYFGGGEIVIEREGHKILMCHGNAYYVKMSLTRLSLRAQELGCDLVLYGHTHIPSVDTDSGMLFVNPGALMDGRYCIIEFRENGPVPLMYTL